MGAFDFLIPGYPLAGLAGGLAGANGTYNVSQGLPGYTPGSTLGGVQNSQAGTQSSIAQQQAFLNALNLSGGLNGTQSGIMGQQQGLANQFGQIAAGQGPNPAQAQLAQNTGQNIQQQAALMGSARGAQSNPGLVARQASQVGGNMQQQAVGQAATLQAQQQIAAMQQQAAQQGQMANLATAGVGQQQTALSQLGQQNLANQQLQQSALTAQNQQQVQAQLGQAGLAGQQMQQQGSMFGGLLGGVGAGLGLALLNRGGQVGGYADGGSVTPVDIQNRSAAALPHPFVQATEGNFRDAQMPDFGTAQPADLGPAKTMLGLMNNIEKSNPLETVGSAPLGTSDLNPQIFSMKASQGGSVGGSAKVKGDSEKNDTVPAMLSPGEVVIPRSHIDDPHKTAQFLNSLMGWNLRAS